MTGAETLIQQGEKHGQIQAAREVLLKFIDLRFGDMPDTVIREISRIHSRSRLNTLLEQAATAQTLDDIKWQ